MTVLAFLVGCIVGAAALVVLLVFAIFGGFGPLMPPPPW